MGDRGDARDALGQQRAVLVGQIPEALLEGAVLEERADMQREHVLTARLDLVLDRLEDAGANRSVGHDERAGADHIARDPVGVGMKNGRELGMADRNEPEAVVQLAFGEQRRPREAGERRILDLALEGSPERDQLSAKGDRDEQRRFGTVDAEHADEPAVTFDQQLGGRIEARQRKLEPPLVPGRVLDDRCQPWLGEQLAWILQTAKRLGLHAPPPRELVALRRSDARSPGK